jgi:hypothetical protein
VQERLGHSGIRVTFDRYGHLFSSLEQESVTRLDETLRKSRVSSPCHNSSDDPHPDAVETTEEASDQDFQLERTTGFEPATLTLAR